MAEGTQVGSIYYDLNLDDEQYKAGLADAKASAASFGDSMDSAGASISRAGSTIMPFSIAAGAALGESVKMATNFNQQMELLHTQAGASQQEVDNLKQSVLDLAPAVGQGPDQLAEALYHIESVGYRGQAAMDVLKLAAEGAAVGQANLDDTTYALTSAMSSQVEGAQNATEAMGYLNAIVGAGDMHMQDLNGAIGTGFLASSKVFGLSLQSTGAALATLTDNGEGADEAATRLRMSMSLMAAPSAAAGKQFAAIGLSTLSLSEDLRKPNGFLVAMDDLKSHLSTTFGPESVSQLQTYSSILSKDGASAADKYAASAGGAAEALSKMFGGGRSDAAILTLMTNTDRLNTKFTDIGKNAGNFSSDWAAQQETANQKMKDFKAQLDVTGVKLGNAFLPILLDLAKDLGKIADAFTKLSPSQQKMIVEALLVVAALGPFLKILGDIFKVVGMVSKVVEFVATDAIPFLVDALGALAVALGISIGWLIAIIAAVIAVGVGIYMLITHFDTVKKYIKQWWDDIKKWFDDGVKAVEGFFDQLGQDIVGFFDQAGSDIEQWIDDIGNFFASIPRIVGKAMEDMGKAILKALEALPGLTLKVLDAIAFAIGYYLRIWKDLFVHWIPDIVMAVVHELEKLPGQVSDIMQDVWNAVSSWFVHIWQDSVKFTKQMFDDVVNFFILLPGRTVALVTAMWNGVTSWVARMWHDVTGFVSQMFNDVIGFFERLPGNILNFVTQLAGAANRIGSGIWHGLMDTLNQLPDLVSGIWDKVLQSIEKAVGKLADGAKKVASSMWNSFKDGLGIHSPSYIENAFTAIGDEGDNTVDRLNKSVGQLTDLSKKASQVVTAPTNTGVGGVNSTMAFANLAINGDINFQNQNDINYFFQKLGRNVELTQQGLTATR